MKIWSIYRIVNAVNGKSYIGITTNPAARKRAHFSMTGAGSIRLSASIKHHGKENFTFEIFACARTQEDAHAVERYLIATEKTKKPFGYNLTDGGEGALGVFTTDDQRKKKSERVSLLFKGRKHSEETKKRMSESRMGFKPSAESVAKMAKALTGRKVSPEVRDRLISYQHLSKTPESRAKLSAALKGRAVPWIWKVAEKNRGREFTEGHKKKLGDAKRGGKQTPEQISKRMASKKATIAAKMANDPQFAKAWSDRGKKNIQIALALRTQRNAYKRQLFLMIA